MYKASEIDRALPIFSWAMYDFANTIYSAIVVTAIMARFVWSLTGRDTPVGITLTVSMILAGLLVPAAGAIADRTGRAKTYLWWLTLGCCAASFSIGLVTDERAYDPANGVFAPVGVVAGVLVLFGLANVAYQGSLVFYNTLLPAVASPARQGRVSGFGVGLGYLGVVVTLPLMAEAVSAAGTMRVAFFAAGAFFLISAIPTFLFVRPPRPERAVAVTWRLVAGQFRELAGTVRTIWRMPPVLFFFLGNFLCVDVVNTLIMWTQRYLEIAVGFSFRETMTVLLAMSASAFVLGLCMGWLTDKLGSKRAMLAAAGSMLACLVAVGLLRNRTAIVVVICVLGSGGLAGVWTAGRKFLIEIAPRERLGEFFGLYGVTIKLSVLGCSLFGILADHAARDRVASYRIALLALVAPMIVGMVFLLLARPLRVDTPAQDPIA